MLLSVGWSVATGPKMARRVHSECRIDVKVLAGGCELVNDQCTVGAALTAFVGVEWNRQMDGLHPDLAVQDFSADLLGCSFDGGTVLVRCHVPGAEVVQGTFDDEVATCFAGE